MRLVSLVALPALLWAASAVAQRPAQEIIDASKMPEAGPLVTGSNGATTGPNSRNQAVSPMPGAADEQLSERPSGIVIPLGPRNSQSGGQSGSQSGGAPPVQPAKPPR